MEGKHLLAGLLMLVVVLSSIAFTLAQDDNVEVEMSAGKTYTVTFTKEGQSKLIKGKVTSLSDRITIKDTLTTNLKITIIIADCCTMGDTIAFYWPNAFTVAAYATSPAIIILGPYDDSAGTYTFWVGYTALGAGSSFPTGFEVWLIATHI